MAVGGTFTPGGPGGGTYRPPGVPVPPWQPPPIPPGEYNPIRDIELAEGKRGSTQAEEKLGRERTNAEQQYGISTSELGRQEKEAEGGYNESLANLAHRYEALKAGQTDQANAGGALYGGALIASGMKRAANEAREKGGLERRRHGQEEGFKAQRGKLLLGLEQLLGSGGSLTEALKNVKENQQGFETSLGTLKGNEAAAAGYQAPTGPAGIKWSRDPKIRALQAKRGY
jgi:hypothetical protein